MSEDNVQTEKKQQVHPVNFRVNFRLIFDIILLSGFILCIPSMLNFYPPPAIKIPAASFEQNIKDHPVSNITDSLFEIPKRLKTQADFWEKIFTHYSQDQVLIHDSWYLDVVYEVVDLKKAGKNPWNKVRAAKEKYRALLKQMAENLDNPEQISPEQMPKDVKRIYGLYKDVSEIPLFKIKEAQSRVHAQQGQKYRFKKALIMSGRYMDRIEKILEEHDVPKELGWLPLIESSFNTTVRSHAGAAGMWQLMPATGRQHGLKINYLIDERCDPFISTKAAVRHLAGNYKSLKSWPLAITAYNHGLGGIRKGVKKVKSKDIADIVEKYDGPRFEFASRNFYVEFLTAVKIAENYKSYFKDIKKESPLEIEQVKIPDYIAAQTIISYTGIKKSKLQKLNPALLPAAFEPGGYIYKGTLINIPRQKKTGFKKAYASIPKNLKRMEISGPKYHKVKKRQTLSHIAGLYKVPVKSLARFNNLRNSGKIRAGQRLKIPGRASALKSNALSKKITKIRGQSIDLGSVSHRVRRGQTLSEIAKMYGISEKAIARLNKIRNLKKIRAGQLLKIPEG